MILNLDFDINNPLTIALLILIVVACIAVVILVLLRKPKFTKAQELSIEHLLGKEAVVVDTIDYDSGSGMIELNGQSWAARALAIDDLYPIGEKVTIVGMEGATLVVKKVD